MATGDYILCGFVTPVKVGDQFSDWPLHVTVVPWFQFKVPLGNLLDALHALVLPHVFTAMVGDNTTFGNFSVSILEATPWLPLHDQLLNFTQRLGTHTAPHNYIGPNYTPHVTHQKTDQLIPSDSFLCDAVYLIKQHGEYKEVVAKVELTHE